MRTKQTLYETYIDAQKKNPEKVAIYTRDGKEITHGKFIEEIDKTAVGLLSYKTDNKLRIGIISSTSYQEAVFLLAASKIGSVSKFIDFTKSVMEIAESIAESSINLLVMGSEFLPIEQYINPKCIPVVILDDTPVSCAHHITYQNLLNSVKSYYLPKVEYVDGVCTVIINSSGTTGKPKPIELSDYALNTAVMKHISSDLPLAKSNIMLKIIPSHIGMGLISTLYTCLITGDSIVYLPANGPQESIEAVIKAIATFPLFLTENHMPMETKLLLFAAPMYYRYLYQFLESINDLSYVGCMLAGGSAMSKIELEEMDVAFAAKGCTVPVLNGYGQNELAGGVTMNEIGANKRGSAGKPMAGSKIKVVDIVSGTQVSNNTIGKILVSSGSLFIGYEGMEEKTKSSFLTDKDGNLWFDTNDVGYLDDDGFLFITGRTSRIIIRYDQKVSLDNMESKIRASMYIKEAGVVALSYIPYDITVAFATLSEEFTNANITPEMIINEVQSSKNPLTELEKLDRLYIVDEIPHLSSGKIDYRALEKQAEEKRKE